MIFTWLKRFMPRSLYGRAALILILPIVTILLVFSVDFFRRHFEDVAQQMTNNLNRELVYILDQVEAEEDLSAAVARVQIMAGALSLDIDFPALGPDVDTRVFYDLSGRTVIQTLRARLPQIEGIDMTSVGNRVRISLPTHHGTMVIGFWRQRVSASNPHQLLVLVTFTGLLMSVISILFLRNQLRPIKRLAYASEAFGKGQSVNYHPSGATEVRAAGRSFLEMRSRIERQIEQRTLMLSGVSHDLRTPLTRLKLALSVADPGPETDAMQRDVDDMEKMLNGFLDFARGAASEEICEADVVALAQVCVENARRAGARISLSQPDAEAGQAKAGIVTSLRPVAVARALDNLIVNAMRYGKTVQVTVKPTSRFVTIIVEDDGPGIAETDREEALKPFTRLEPARNQNRGPGVGLGLSIALDVARSHGGTLKLARSSAHGGLRAEIVLPR